MVNQMIPSPIVGPYLSSEDPCPVCQPISGLRPAAVRVTPTFSLIGVLRVNFQSQSFRPRTGPGPAVTATRHTSVMISLQLVNGPSIIAPTFRARGVHSLTLWLRKRLI